MSKIFKILIGTVLLLFLVIIIGGYIFIKTFNFNDYKTDVSELASQKLGRKLLINGDAHIGISLFPTIIVEDVELANAPWATSTPMVKVKRFEIQFALLPLLKKQIEISTISLIEPQINLEIAKNGDKNWIFDIPKTPQTSSLHLPNLSLISSANANEIIASKESNNNNFALVGLAAQSIKIEDGSLIYNDKGKITTIKLSHLNLSIPNPDAPISLDFEAELENTPITGQATVGSINNLLHNPQSYPLILTLNAYGLDLALDGSISNLTQNISYNFQTNLYNPAGNLSMPETTLEAQITGNTKNINANISTLNIVNNLISGKVNINIAASRPYIKADLQSSVFDLRVFNPNSPTAQLIPDLISSAQATELVPATPIPYNSLNYVNADITLAIGKLIINNALQADNINLTVQLKNSVLAITPLKMNFGGGEIDASLALSAPTKHASLKMNGKNLLLQNLHQEFQISENGDFGISNGGNLDFDLNLKSNGNTIRSMVSNLSGQIAAVVGQTQIKTGKFKFITSNFISQLLDILGLKKDVSQNIDVACAAIHSDLSSGMAKFPQGIALESKQMNIVSDGTINLQNDKIDLRIQPNIKDVSLVQALSSFIKIKGTLQNPKLALDNTSTAKAIIGIAATGGTAYLGSQLMSTDSSPCYTALQGTIYAKRFNAPSGAANAAKGVYQNAEDSISNGVKNLTDSAKGVINMFKNSLKSNQ